MRAGHRLLVTPATAAITAAMAWAVVGKAVDRASAMVALVTEAKEAAMVGRVGVTQAVAAMEAAVGTLVVGVLLVGAATLVAAVSVAVGPRQVPRLRAPVYRGEARQPVLAVPRELAEAPLATL